MKSDNEKYKDPEQRPLDGFPERLAYCVDLAGNAAKLSKMTGISRPTIADYLSGKSDPSRLRLINIARTLNVSLEWLATGHGSKTPKGVPTLRDIDQQRWNDGSTYTKSPEELKKISEHEDLGFMSLPVIDIPASAGGGTLFLKHDYERYILFERLFLKNNLNMNVDALFCMYCVGESMEPTIHSGELMIATREQSYLKPSDGIYITRLEGHVIVKRLQIIPGNRILISADNPNYKPYEIPLDDGTDFQILGKVVMVTGPRRV